MEIKNKFLIILVILLLTSLTVNLYLIKHKVEVNIIRQGQNLRKILKTEIRSFQDNFENGNNSGWKGNVRTDNTYQGSRFSLEIPQISNPWFACGTDKSLRPKLLKIKENMKIEFAYYIENGSLIRVQCYNPIKKDNFGLTIDYPVLGKWVEVSFNFTDFIDNASKSHRVEPGDVFSNIQIYGGSSGEDTLFFIDDLVVSEGS